jgi:hypothetical protein
MMIQFRGNEARFQGFSKKVYLVANFMNKSTTLNINLAIFVRFLPYLTVLDRIRSDKSKPLMLNFKGYPAIKHPPAELKM